LVFLPKGLLLFLGNIFIGYMFSAWHCAKGSKLIFLKMKALKFKKVLLVGVFAGLFFLPVTADAKMFGQECSSVTTDNGVCSVTICRA
jgi:hypothetical protein